MRLCSTLSSVVALLFVTACVGKFEDDRSIGGDVAGSGGAPTAPGYVPPTADSPVPATVGLRRLTRIEIRNVLQDVLGVDASKHLGLLVEDSVTPFDNDYTTQSPSLGLIEGQRAFAQEVSRDAFSEEERANTVLGCEPSGPGDAACFESFVRTMIPRFVRRDLAEDEVSELLALQRFSEEAGDFRVGARLVLEVLVQDPEFLYRIENGQLADDGSETLFLDGFALASRLSFFLWASAPDEALLTLARDGSLRDPEVREREARRMLSDARGLRQIQRFHALWLGYDQLRHDQALSNAMKTESNALIARVLDSSSWLDAFRSEETYVNAALAENYGMPAPPGADFAWSRYSSAERKGLLSHASVLSNGAKFGDTSPVQRGLFIRERLLCQHIPPPPPTVNADDPPAAVDEDACKAERYSMHASGSCAGCHNLLDPVGFGLEAYDDLGRFRSTEPDRPDCPIDGGGRLEGGDGAREFRGPGSLAELLVESGELSACAVNQLHRFAHGRTDREDDQVSIDHFTESFVASGHRFDELLVDFVADGSFAYRSVE